MTSQVESARLSNGMDVVLVVDRRAPVVTHMVWYRNGSADDPAAKSGIAHFLEHLMFKGTAKYPEGAFSREISGLGGQENAFTSYDYTAYFQRVPSQHLRKMMDYEADRMCGLAFDEAVVAPERDVVLEERRMRVDADPHAELDERLSSAIFAGHPYGIPIIGWQTEIEQLNRDDAFAYYQRFYTPENAILVVAGDTDLATVMRDAEATYGKVAARGAAPQRQRPAMPPRAKADLVKVEDQRVKQPVVHKLWQAPSYRTDQGAAFGLDLAMSVLGEGATSRLYEKLVIERGLAASASAYYLGSLRDGGVIYVSLTPHDRGGIPALERACEEVIADFLDKGPTATELTRAKTQLVADTIFSRDSQSSMARSFGAALSIGETVADVMEWPDRIEVVSADEALAAARAVLRPDRCVTGLLLPQSSPSQD